MKITLELPDTMAKRFQEKGVSLSQIVTVVMKFLNFYLDTQLVNVEPEKPTIAQLCAELRQIQHQEPIEIEILPRVDRHNPMLESPDAFFV
ncbi:hypothetical protein QUF63_00470 [Anaerolineales bacterium HSG25]|nr:hypothetical protein [Anaerolineales bacterium HSG25]